MKRRQCVRHIRHIRDIRYVALVAALLTASACRRDPFPTAPARAGLAVPASHDESGATISSYRAELEGASEGLVYTSEVDYPFAYFAAAARIREPLDALTFATLIGASAEEPIEERTLDDALARHIERVDPADAVARGLVPRYERLKETIQESLNDRTVFCVGGAFKRCYFTGTDEHGNVVGLATWVLET